MGSFTVATVSHLKYLLRVYNAHCSRWISRSNNCYVRLLAITCMNTLKPISVKLEFGNFCGYVYSSKKLLSSEIGIKSDFELIKFTLDVCNKSRSKRISAVIANSPSLHTSYCKFRKVFYVAPMHRVTPSMPTLAHDVPGVSAYVVTLAEAQQ